MQWSRKVKVLFFLRSLNIGGAEAFIYNVLSSLDNQKVHIDIVIQTHENKNKQLLHLCAKKDIKIFYVAPFEKNYYKSIKELNGIIKENAYDIIHYHANSLINMVPVICAKKNNIRLVLHSHNSNNNLGGHIGKCIHYFNRFIISRLKVTRIACGNEAGCWMFGNKKFTIINNAINIDSYRFDITARDNLRKKYDIANNCYVLGHVGRFVEAKNHKFIIDCFEHINMNYSNVKLVLVGTGDLFNDIRDYVKQKKLDEIVIFIGEAQECSMYYSAFDMMLFPSFFEGLPFTLVEAQASGLPVAASNNVTKQVNITGLVKYISLNESIDTWTKEIMEHRANQKDRSIYAEIMKESIFDINAVIEELADIYVNGEGK